MGGVLAARALYEVRDVPVLQNRTFESAEAARACSTGDVVLVQDPATGLISNAAFDASLVEYDTGYQNEQATSAVFRQHLEAVGDLVRLQLGGRSLLEVGCGKGAFLEHLQGRGFEVRGVDPAYEGTNPAVVKAKFTPGLDLHADAVILRHVLEHVEDPLGFLSQIRDANAGTGSIYVEVPCFDWICQHRAWFDVFYEHVNYFRLPDLHAMFGTVHDSGQLFGGQYIYVVADLATLRSPGRSVDDVAVMPPGFLASVESMAARFLHAADSLSVWGAASKGVIFALFMERSGVGLNMAIDINPAKQGQYLPSTGLRVSSPEEALATLAPGSPVVVMNSNYLAEVADATSQRFTLLTVDHADI